MGQPLVQPQQPQALTPGSLPPAQPQVQIQQAPQHSPALCYFFSFCAKDFMMKKKPCQTKKGQEELCI